MTIPKTMKVARALERGGALRVHEVPVPVPEPGQVLIRVQAAGVNFSDLKRRRGDLYPFETTFPFVPGGEIAGTIAAHGPGVEGPPIGAPVLALAGATGEGGYAQYAVAYAPTAMQLPPGLDPDAASVLLVAGTTARLVLTQAARLVAGETVLVSAATGGVGSYALQIARQLDARRVIAGVGHASKREAALALGAHEVVDLSRPDWPAQVRALTEGRGADVVLESYGGEALAQSLEALAPFGRLVVYGAASGRSGTLDARAIDRVLYAPAPNQSILAFNVGTWFQLRPDVAGPALGALVHDVLAGRVRVPAIDVLSLDDAQAAHDRLEARRVSGKLVIHPWA